MKPCNPYSHKLPPKRAVNVRSSECMALCIRHEMIMTGTCCPCEAHLLGRREEDLVGLHDRVHLLAVRRNLGSGPQRLVPRLLRSASGTNCSSALYIRTA